MICEIMQEMDGFMIRVKTQIQRALNGAISVIGNAEHNQAELINQNFLNREYSEVKAIEGPRCWSVSD